MMSLAESDFKNCPIILYILEDKVRGDYGRYDKLVMECRCGGIKIMSRGHYQEAVFHKKPIICRDCIEANKRSKRYGHLIGKKIPCGKVLDIKGGNHRPSNKDAVYFIVLCNCGRICEKVSKDLYKTKSCKVCKGIQVTKGKLGKGQKLTKELVISIRELHKTGHYMFKEISEMFGVSQSQVSNICHRKSWTSVK